MTNPEIEWVDELPPAGHSVPNETVEALKKRPGQWARLRRNASYAGNLKSLRNRGCETATRALPPEDGKRRYDLYARWPAAAVPNPAQAAPRTAPAALPPLDPRLRDAPGRPRRMVAETEQAYRLRLDKWVKDSNIR